MRRDRRQRRAKEPDGGVRPRMVHRKVLVPAGGVIVVTVAVSVALLASRDRKPPAAPVTSVVVAHSERKLETQRLVGNWVRPDGGYVLSVRTIDPTGQAEAAYFNPGPIHVARANVSSPSNRMKLFVELRDKGYPGSTYELTYDPNDDTLEGIYFQAQIQRRFDVVFLRMN